MVGIINVQWFDNPGAVLLCYALQETVKTITPYVKIIDYAAGGGKIKNQTLTCKIVNKLKYVGLKIKSARRIDGMPYYIRLNYRHDRYKEFRSRFLMRTESFTNINMDILADYSHYIVGSDVVWKPEIVDSDHSYVYFLKFAKKEAVKISYAASIGTSDMAVLEPLKNKYRNLISYIDYLSLRENDSADFIRALTDKPVVQCIDPVFLLKRDDYLKIFNTGRTKKYKPDKYIYLYLLSPNRDAILFVKRLASEKKLPVLFDLHTTANMTLFHELGKKGMPSVDDGPIDFLENIENAEYIVTNSFHGTAFSLIFHKIFYTFGHSNAGIDISARMTDLLGVLGLSTHYIKKSAGCIPKHIDYESVDRKIEDMRKYAFQFLTDALTS